MSHTGCIIEGRLVVMATRNPGKVGEILRILSGWPVTWKYLEEFGEITEPDETGETFAANARNKAWYYARATDCLALADDSGLQVDVLGGRPGVHSARYAGPGKSDSDNNAKLIRELAGVPAERRTARFRCAVALAGPEGVIAEAEGSVAGRIIDAPRGRNGFGYDPLFLVPELGLTTAELSPSDKARISHRGRALRALAEKLSGL
jgi:XTP/dITP diphosphohydrolase